MKTKIRTNLKVFRVQRRMTQAEFAKEIGVARGQYAGIEQGTRNGSIDFWNALQKTFSVGDEAMWELMKVDED